MAAALTIAVLLALSISIVRIAGVAMRLTGLPENIARFQCLSALTGTGFTTHESEMIVNYPIRRRILVALMVIGNLGLVSVAGTFIVALVDAGEGGTSILWQVTTVLAAIGVIFVMTTFKRLDRVMCDFVGVILTKMTSLGDRRYQRILQLDDGYSIAEHTIGGTQADGSKVLSATDNPVEVLAVRDGKTREFGQMGDDQSVSPGDVLICFGTEEAHDSFEDEINNPGRPNASC